MPKAACWPRERTDAKTSTEGRHLAIGIRGKEFRGGRTCSTGCTSARSIVTRVSMGRTRQGDDGDIGGVISATSAKVSASGCGNQFEDAHSARGQWRSRSAVQVCLSVSSGRSSRASVSSRLGHSNGVIRSRARRIWFVHGEEGPAAGVEVNARQIGSPLGAMIEILDAKGKPVGPQRYAAAPRMSSSAIHSAARAFASGWNRLAMDDYVYLGNSAAHRAASLNPDADCSFYAVNGQRSTTGATPAHHPNGEPIYKVEMPPTAFFPSAGCPSSISLSQRRRRARLWQGLADLLQSSADGEYTVRIGDARNEGGRISYRLTVRPPRPDFSVSTGPAPSV